MGLCLIIELRYMNSSLDVVIKLLTVIWDGDVVRKAGIRSDYKFYPENLMKG